MKSPAPEKKVLDFKYTSIHESDVTKLVDENKKPTSKISVVWPPQVDSTKKTFTVDEELKLVKPSWPPKEDSSPGNDQLNQMMKPRETGVEAPEQNRPRDRKNEESLPAPDGQEAPVVLHTPRSEESNSGANTVVQTDSEVSPGAEEEDGNKGDVSGGGEGMEGQEESAERLKDVRENGLDEQAVDEGAEGNKGETVKVTFIDEDSAGLQALNANANNNNNQILVEVETLDGGFGEGGPLLQADFSQTGAHQTSELTPREALQLAWRDDASRPAGAKQTAATDDVSVFPETAEGTLEFNHITTGPTIGTPSFLQGISGGLSVGSPDLLPVFRSDAAGAPAVLELDDLLDFGLQLGNAGREDEGNDGSVTEQRSGAPAGTEDDGGLTVEEQMLPQQQQLLNLVQ